MEVLYKKEHGTFFQKYIFPKLYLAGLWTIGIPWKFGKNQYYTLKQCTKRGAYLLPLIYFNLSFIKLYISAYVTNAKLGTISFLYIPTNILSCMASQISVAM